MRRMTELIKIQAPVITKRISRDGFDYFLKNNRGPSGRALREAFQKSENPIYLHWESLKRKSWIPTDISPTVFWTILKNYRRRYDLQSPIATPDENNFTWYQLPRFDKTLHEVDMNLGGSTIGLSSLSETEKRKIITHRLIEEAIASSQMEGAHTTREVAKKMIQENRQPVDQGQRMILNNYKIMQRIENETKNENLNFDVLLDLHAELTKGTLDKKDQEGRLRYDSENIVVGNEIDGQIAYIPPEMKFVREELDVFFAFANDELDIETRSNIFIHPIIKAIMLHFWIGYLHPFSDGNGRMARALFYWYLLRKGYWMFAYLPLSVCIKKSPSQYAKAYLQSEQDDFDLTYFIDYNMRKIIQAQRDFEKFMEDQRFKKPDNKKIQKKFPSLNPRQIRLIQFFRAKPNERTNMSSMIQIHGISSGTAVKDLRVMENQGLLYKRKNGLNVFYYPTEKLLED